MPVRIPHIFRESLLNNPFCPISVPRFHNTTQSFFCLKIILFFICSSFFQAHSYPAAFPLFSLARNFFLYCKMGMDQQKIHKNNDPENAMSEKDKVQSNDRKMKQDFPGYPHNPASEDVLKADHNWRTDFSNENDTTATGSESIRAERPTEEENELKNGSDRGLRRHDVDPGKTG